MAGQPCNRFEYQFIRACCRDCVAFAMLSPWIAWIEASGRDDADVKGDRLIAEARGKDIAPRLIFQIKGNKKVLERWLMAAPRGRLDEPVGNLADIELGFRCEQLGSKRDIDSLYGDRGRSVPVEARKATAGRGLYSSGPSECKAPLLQVRPDRCLSCRPAPPPTQ